MKHKNILFVLLSSFAVSCSMAVAQAPVASIDPASHGALAAAQQSIIQAFASISQAQGANDDHLGGHAGRAKALLNQANQELLLAAQFADSHGSESGPAAPAGIPAQDQPTPNLSGNWTIYAYNVDRPGSSLKEVQLSQNGNILSGTFHGPNQHGKLQGWISGSHVEFSTDTRDVLTFRGQITSSGMSGLYGVHGQQAPWSAERTN